MSEKKTVLITGAARGIGLAIAKQYRDRGWSVLAPTRSELDVGSLASIEKYFSEFQGALHAIVNNAGINPINLIEKTLESDLETTVSVNLLGPFRILRSALPALRLAQGCRWVVNISSIWANVAKPGRSAYSISKSGLSGGLTRTAALELARDGILVNSVAPGFTETELTKQNNSDDILDSIRTQIPLSRLAQPAEIANAVYFLGSELNSYITGQTLLVDGGYTCQ